MLRVVLVDDEQTILSGLERAIDWQKYDCEVVGTAGDGLEGVALCRREKPDILITDIRMPNMDGLAMIAALKSEFPNLQISVLTAFRDFEYAQRAIRLGVMRYLLKPSKMAELSEAIDAMVARCRALGVTHDLPETVMEQASQPAQEGVDAEASEASCFVLNAAMDYIRAHCCQSIRLQDVADATYVSQWHLSKLINRHMNQSFLDIVNNLRIEKAKTLLREPSLKVHEVSDLVGFSDVAHFSKTFKRLCGKSPAEYRQGLR